MDANGRPYSFFSSYNSPKSFTVALPFPAKSLFATIAEMECRESVRAQTR